MKRMLCIIMMLLSLFCFSSCSENVNMEKLTGYQKNGFRATANITLDGIKYRTYIEKTRDSVSFSFTEPSELKDITFITNENGVFLKTNGLNAPICEGRKLLKSEKISSLFSIQSYGSWKIEKASPGGVAVYVCTNESEDITIYIDRGTKLPLKIIRKGTEADIISFEATTQ